MLSISALNSATLLTILELLENECQPADLLDEDADKITGKNNKLHKY